MNPEENDTESLAAAETGKNAVGGNRKPRFGTLRGKIAIVDPDWWKPMSGEEADRFLEEGIY